MSSTVAHLYRILPVSLQGRELTVASPQIVDRTLREELRTLLGLTIQSITVDEDHFIRALNLYYPDPIDAPPLGSFCIHPYSHPREPELKDLCKRIIRTVSDAAGMRVSLQCTERDLKVIIGTGREEEGAKVVADRELGLRLITRLKVMATLDITAPYAQTGSIELTDRRILVETRADADAHIIDLFLDCGRVQNGG